jgi:hypothetical protein
MKMKNRQELHRELWIRVIAARVSAGRYVDVSESAKVANDAIKEFDKKFDKPWGEMEYLGPM